MYQVKPKNASRDLELKQCNQGSETCPCYECFEFLESDDTLAKCEKGYFWIVVNNTATRIDQLSTYEGVEWYELLDRFEQLWYDTIVDSDEYPDLYSEDYEPLYRFDRLEDLDSEGLRDALSKDQVRM
jgi:hypothetical protein